MLALRYREVIDFLKRGFRKSPTSIERVILFGSVARGDFKPHSDIDIAVIYSDDLREAKKFSEKIADSVYLEFSIPITIIYISKEDFNSNKTSLIKTIKKEGVIIWMKS